MSSFLIATDVIRVSTIHINCRSFDGLLNNPFPTQVRVSDLVGNRVLRSNLFYGAMIAGG